MTLKAIADKEGLQGYVYTTYGEPHYLKYAASSVISLRRYDPARPVALVCDGRHLDLVNKHSLEKLFDRVLELKPENSSIVGFKHNVYNYMPFDRNLFLDSDMIWCKNPDPLWTSMSVYPFTITGTQSADHFFGGPKNMTVLADILLKKRRRTLDRFGLTYLSRLQSGMMYAKDRKVTREVCELAKHYFSQADRTHFRSRLREKGRTEESCEWSIAMAMSRLELPVYPWLQGATSPQLDFVENYTMYDPDFKHVKCRYFSDKTIYNLRALKSDWLRKILTTSLSFIPGKGDYMDVTPFCLHFGTYHEKQPLIDYSEKIWRELTR